MAEEKNSKATLMAACSLGRSGEVFCSVAANTVVTSRNFLIVKPEVNRGVHRDIPEDLTQLATHDGISEPVLDCVSFVTPRHETEKPSGFVAKTERERVDSEHDLFLRLADLNTNERGIIRDSEAFKNAVDQLLALRESRGWYLDEEEITDCRLRLKLVTKISRYNTTDGTTDFVEPLVMVAWDSECENLGQRVEEMIRAKGGLVEQKGTFTAKVEGERDAPKKPDIISHY